MHFQTYTHMPLVSETVVDFAYMYSFFLILYEKKVEENHDSLDEGQQRVLTSFLRSARNGGVGLNGKEKEHFNALQLKLAELTNRFR